MSHCIGNAGHSAGRCCVWSSNFSSRILCVTRLEEEDLVLKLGDGTGSGVAELLEVSPEMLAMLPHHSLHGSHHWGGTAEEHLGAGCNTARVHVLADHVLGDEARSTDPVLGNVVESVVDLETAVGGVGKVLDFVAKNYR